MGKCQPQILQGETEEGLVERVDNQIVDEQSHDNVLVTEGPKTFQQRLHMYRTERMKKRIKILKLKIISL